MPFTFTDYTYSGLLSFVTVLFSFAYPEIIKRIEKVDERYKSEILTDRCRREPAFLVFRILLVVNIIAAILFPFLMYGLKSAYCFLEIQGFLTTLLIASAFCMYHTILVYIIPSRLNRLLWRRFSNVFGRRFGKDGPNGKGSKNDGPNAEKPIRDNPNDGSPKIRVAFDVLVDDSITVDDPKKKQEKKREKQEKKRERQLNAEAIRFSEWVDASKMLLASSNLEQVRQFYDQLYEYIANFYKCHKLDDENYDYYFYDGITRLNEALCQMRTTPISYHNGNDILTSLIILDKRVTMDTYSLLWRNLRIQLFYEKDDWIMAYWTQASQKYRLFMRIVSEFEKNPCTGVPYTQAEIEQIGRDRWVFFRFHIMIGALALSMGKYDLLKRMLSFTQDYPPSYPLIPSTVSEVCTTFMKLHKDCQKDPFFMGRMFPMPKMNGISDGKILGAAYEYLSLLMLRIYTIQLPFGVARAMNLPIIPIQLGELRDMKDSIVVLLQWVNKTTLNKKLLAVIGVDEFEETIKWVNNNNDGSIVAPDMILKNLITTIDNQIKSSKKDLPFDEQKIERLFKEITHYINERFSYLDEFLVQRNFPDEVPYNIDGSTYQIYPNAAFVENPDIGYGGIEDVASDSITRIFNHFFEGTFFQTSSISYSIDDQNVFDCIDRLSLKGSHTIISFGVFWDYYLDRKLEFKKVDETHYTYKHINIQNLPGSRLSKDHFYVLSKDELPYLTFEDPNEDLMNTYNFKRQKGKCGLWLSLQKVKEHPNMLTREQQERMQENPDEMAVLAAHLVAELHWKKDVHMIQVHVKHNLHDGDRKDDLNKIVAF